MAEEQQDNSPGLGGQSDLTGREPRLGGENALHHLALSLESPDWRTRREAAEALSQLGTGATTLLIEALRSQNMHTRRVATQTLGLIGGKEGVEALIGALADSEVWVRQDAALSLIQALPQLRDTAMQANIVDKILERIAHDEDQALRRKTKKSLRAVRNEIAPVLAVAFGHEDRGVAASAWSLLRHPGNFPFGAAYPLIECLATSISSYPIETLAAMHAARVELSTWLIRMFEASDPPAQRTIREEMGAYALASGPALLRTLIQDDYQNASLVAIQELGRVTDKEAVPGLTAALLNPAPAAIHIATTKALIDIEGYAALPVLMQGIRQEPDADVRLNQVRMLDRILDKRCAEFLLELAEADPDGPTRVEAVTLLTRGLYRIRVPAEIELRALQALNKIGGTQDTCRLAATGLQALAKRAYNHEIIYRAALDTLFEIGRNDSPDVRAWIAQLLPGLPAADAVPGLVGYLSDTGESWSATFPGSSHPARICDYAAYLLRTIGTPEALEAIEQWRQGRGG